MEEEIRLHLEYETEKYERDGLDREEARRRAVVAFGGMQMVREELREGRGLPWLESVARDLRFAVRTLSRSPGFTLSAVLTLALGIGATTAIFGAVNSTLLAPLAYPEPDRLVRVYLQNSPTNLFGPSVVDYRAMEEQQRSFSAIGAARARTAALVVGGTPETVSVGEATPGFFRALDVRVGEGRTLAAADEDPSATPVTLVSAELADHAFGGSRSAIGKVVTLDGVAHTVIGVLPPAAAELAGIRADVWPVLRLPEPTRRGPFGLFVVARLRDGVPLSAARGDLEGISRRIFPLWASSFQDATASLTAAPLRDAILGGSGRTLWIFAASVGLLLLIALANVAGLMLVRATRRSHEWAVRAALGASRARIARHLLTESLVLTTIGAAAGLLVAGAVLRGLVTAGLEVPRLREVRPDAGFFALATALAILTGVGISLHPILSLFRGSAAPRLRGGNRAVGAGRGAGAARGLLVAAEFALALPLLAGAALFLNSFLRLQQVDPGFDPAPILAISVSLPDARYPDGHARGRYWRRALERLRELPGVRSAAVSTTIPPEQVWNDNNFDLLDTPVPEGTAQPTVPWLDVTPRFFEALGVPLIEGRMFAAADSAGAPPVILVSRAWVRRFSPDRSAVGRRLVSGGCTECPPTTIVGVVGDIKYGGLAGGTEAAYEPLAQSPARAAALLVRVAGRPGASQRAVQVALRSIDPAIPLQDAGPLADRLRGTLAPARRRTTVLIAFAAAALGLSAVGIFGMLSYLVATRRREIGVRLALGADRGAVVRMVVRSGMIYSLAGAGAGVVLALGAVRWIRSMLFEVAPYAPATLLVSTLLLLGVGLGACWLPARRAAEIDPAQALRAD
jgi:predicted permease